MRIANLALLAAGLGLSLAAIDATRPEFAAFANDLRALVPEDQRGTLAAATDDDGTGDHYHPSGEAPGITPPDADIVLGASFQVEMTEAGILNCGTGGTVCSAPRAGEPVGTSFHGYAGTMGAPPEPATGKRIEFGVSAFDDTPRDGRPAEAWEAIPEFPGDFFRGSNVTWTLLSENGEPFRLLRLEYGPGDAGFLAAPTDAIAIVRGSAWAIIVPGAEWEGTVNGRLYTFRADGDDFAPATTVVDTFPDIFEPAQPSASRPTIALSSVPSRDLPVGWIFALAAGVLLVLVLGPWLARRRRRARSG